MRISKLVTLAAGLIVSLPLSAWEADAAPFPLPLLVEASDIVLAQMPVDDGPEMMWHGFRGVREPRPGYRRHSNGWWYPIGAFAAGSLLGMGAAFDRPPPLRMRSRRHPQGPCGSIPSTMPGARRSTDRIGPMTTPSSLTRDHAANAIPLSLISRAAIAAARSKDPFPGTDRRLDAARPRPGRKQTARSYTSRT